MLEKIDVEIKKNMKLIIQVKIITSYLNQNGFLFLLRSVILFLLFFVFIYSCN